MFNSLGFLQKYSKGVGNLNGYGLIDDRVQDRYYVPAAIPDPKFLGDNISNFSATHPYLAVTLIMGIFALIGGVMYLNYQKMQRMTGGQILAEDLASDILGSTRIKKRRKSRK